nr:tRNA nucleotidyltransferase [uncultured bacterium]
MMPPEDLRQALPQLALAAAGRATLALSAVELATMCSAVQMDALERLSAAERWALLAAALMAPYPVHFFEALRACAGLKRLLPELDALFGVPQLCDGPDTLDVGEHQLRVVAECARSGLPLALRFAALMHKLGMAGTPRDIWPSHYKHELRGHLALDRIARRISVPLPMQALAHLVIDECERVHRASDMRAGPIAAMLERLQAQEQPERLEQLLSICTCDYAAYPGHSAADYPKAPRLRRALDAYTAIGVEGLSPDAALIARAEAIARVLRSGASLR